MIALTLLLVLAAADGPADEPQAKPAPPSAPAQDPDRPALSVAELKALRDNNIFSPRTKRPTRSSSYTNSRKESPAPVKPRAPMVTGIFFDAKAQAHLAIVEDKNDSSHKLFKDPKFMKAGDEWAGITLISVSQEKAVFSKGGASKDVHIGESLPESDEKPVSSTDGEDSVADDAEVPAGDPAAKPQKPVRPESKSLTPETQTRTLEEMKRRIKKKNRPNDNEE